MIMMQINGWNNHNSKRWKPMILLGHEDMLKPASHYFGDVMGNSIYETLSYLLY